jgi:hypothetical protein
MSRRSALIVLLSVVAGLILTAASMLRTQDIGPAPDGYPGEARVLGFPFPYYYVLTSDRDAETMRYEVFCTISLSCHNGPGPQPGRGPFAEIPFALDLAFWSTASCLLLVAGRWLLARRSSATELL